MLNSAAPLQGRTALVAVSGGSDSLALLYWMINAFPDGALHCATVDHGLRPEAAREAAQVAAIADQLGLPHRTLAWRPKDLKEKTSSADARLARYHLLHQHAREIGADLIALGHTKNDQAETVLMRALRCRSDSNTRGLAGMAEWATFHGIHLWRPLLRFSRQELRDRLQSEGISWIEDPTNRDTSYERVRARQSLADQTDPSTPTVDQLTRLAALSGQTRRWMNHQVVDSIRHHVTLGPGAGLKFKPTPNWPRSVNLEVLACLIQVVGEQNFSPPISKLAPIADALASHHKSQLTLGRCLISAKAGQATIRREQRGRPKPDRYPETKLTARALEAFRPAFDDSLHAAMVELLDSPCCST